MKLATFVSPQGPAVGAVLEDTIADLSGEFPSMLALIDGGDAALELARKAALRAPRRPLAGTKLLSPVPEPRQIRDFNNFEQHIRDAPWGVAKLRARLAGQPEPDRSKVHAVCEVTFKQPIFYISNRFNVVGHDA